MYDGDVAYRDGVYHVVTMSKNATVGNALVSLFLNYVCPLYWVTIYVSLIVSIYIIYIAPSYQA